MTPLEGQPILSAAAMRAAEEAAMTNGASVDTLMAAAGRAVAAAVRRLAEGSEVLVLCGPGNNGGDGYVAAAALAKAGMIVRVAALGEPKSDAAKRARAGWAGPVETLAEAKPATVLVDAVFGTGLSRPLSRHTWESGDPGSSTSTDEDVGAFLHALADAARFRIAVDLPSGVATDDGKVLTEPPVFHLTLALGAAKPSHLLQPSARYCGEVRVLDIGVPVQSDIAVLARPDLSNPGPDAHKYTRGMVAVVAGGMAGASELAAYAAMRAGAGYVTLLGETAGPPHALVRTPFSVEALASQKIGAVVVGPGLGRDDSARQRLDAALGSGHPIVIDGDALRIVDRETLAAHDGAIVLTPHAGEFDPLFGKSDADKIGRARAAASATGAVVVFKGADTVIAAPDGRVRIAGDSSDWLSTAGTGDVLAGAIGAMLAAGLDPLDAAAAGVWLHGDAARRLGPNFLADDLADMLGQARAYL